jgi:hypothetical protein
MAMFATCWLVVGIVATEAAGRDQNAAAIVQTSALEDWQLIAESPEGAHDSETSDLMRSEEELPAEEFVMEEHSAEPWRWRWLPEGLIYHSYMAGVHEPRMALVAFYEDSDDRALWDATLGGRVGLLQYGNGDLFCPAGMQLDFYGAAIARLDVENRQDLDSTDYVFGLPLTWGDEVLQFKCGYAHLSSHLGDEFAIRNPGSLAERINYVRDSLEFGISYYVFPALRTYAEIDWAFHRSGGAKPLQFEFGSELSKPGPTAGSFTPFVAVHGRMRQEVDYGGDLALQFGWLRRGFLGQTLRFAGHYYNGKSSQSQFFESFEQQIGMGIWYDF